MAGQTAARLYRLLPPLMPLKDKYELARSLWRHVCPSTHKVIRCGTDSHHDRIVAVVQDYVANVVREYRIKESLTNRFNWLAAGDISVQQQLLNHLLLMEKAQAVQAVSAHLTVLLGHMREAGAFTTRLAHTIHIGKHTVEILIDADASGVQIEEPRSIATTPSLPVAKSGASLAWLWWLLGIGLVVLLMALRSH
jgi:hypothetical protein